MEKQEADIIGIDEEVLKEAELAIKKENIAKKQTAPKSGTAKKTASEKSGAEVKDEEKKDEETKTKSEDDEATLKRIDAKVSDDDTMPLSTMTLRRILGGDILTAKLVREHIWLYLLIMLFLVIYVAFRYQCQQDMITIDKLDTELKDAKYKALSSNSTLTEKCRESHILQRLKDDKDSLLHISDQPPYIINVPEDGE